MFFSITAIFFVTVGQNIFPNKIPVLLSFNKSKCALDNSKINELTYIFFFFHILVNRCELEDISLEDDQTGFTALTSLQIQDNKLKNWQSIFCLNFLPILQGQAHHMFSQFPNLRIFVTKLSFFCFLLT